MCIHKIKERKMDKINIYCRNLERAEQVKTEIRSFGGKAEITQNEDGSNVRVVTTEYDFRRWKL